MKHKAQCISTHMLRGQNLRIHIIASILALNSRFQTILILNINHYHGNGIYIITMEYPQQYFQH